MTVILFQQFVTKNVQVIEESVKDQINAGRLGGYNTEIIKKTCTPYLKAHTYSKHKR